MNDNENYLLSSTRNSNGDDRTAVLDHIIDPSAALVADLPEQGARQPSENFNSLTYVSSKGFFFQ